jgi:hypothetical protein
MFSMPVIAHTEPTSPTDTVKRYLLEYSALLQRRDALQNELERFQEATVRATAHLSPMPHCGKAAPDSMENAMLRVVDAQERLRVYIAHIGEALCVRLALLEQVPDERQKTLLTLRYINGKSWEQIGYIMHYERTQVFAIHVKALEAVQTAMNAARKGSPEGKICEYPLVASISP